ncbi:hypothetical protein SteCoe_23067 [Stentor coeruleus]|uniref:Uncharacterized protein n=1 Tax=Stentor coeruleus TaxID=5963 RepID=A0A1R2BKS2_9CILI|nr:hypothetical protein SteCoe_23067 [Stentor coeruleus]
MTLDTFDEASKRNIGADVIIAIVMLEYAVCILLNVLQFIRRMNNNLVAFYLFLLIQSVLIEIYFSGHFLGSFTIGKTVMFFASDMFLSTSINSMVYEWLRIVILSKSVITNLKRKMINKSFFTILFISIFLWIIFLIFISLGIWTSLSLVEIMLILYIVSAFVNFILVSIIGLKLIKTYEYFLEDSNNTLSRWIYIGIVISLFKIIVPSLFLIDSRITNLFEEDVVSWVYTLISHNFGGILPMIVYHKSFKISFFIVDDSKKSGDMIEAHIRKITLFESEKSLESLDEGYALQ